MDHGPPGSSIHGILRARTLEWVAMSSSSEKVRSEWSRSACPTLWPHGPWPARLLRPWDSPGKRTGVGCCFLLQKWLLIAKMFNVVPKRVSIQIHTPVHSESRGNRRQGRVGEWSESQPIGSRPRGHLKGSLHPRSAPGTQQHLSQHVFHCLVFLLATAGGLWNLSSLTRDQPGSHRQWKQEVLTTGPPGNSHQSPTCVVNEWFEE